MSKYIRQGAVFKMAQLRSQGYSPEEIGRAFNIPSEEVNELLLDRENQLEMSLKWPDKTTALVNHTSEDLNNPSVRDKPLSPLPSFQRIYSKADNDLAKKNQLENRSTQMAMLRKQGYTLEEIGIRFKMTRERVRQILRKNSGNDRQDLVSLSRAISTLGCKRETLFKLIEDGILTPAFACGKRFFFKESDIQSVQIPKKLCTICGEPVPKGRNRYCCDECFHQRWSYRYWSEERKAKHKELVKRWHEQHPEQSKAIQSKASYRYQRKIKKLRKFDSMVQNVVLSQNVAEKSNILKESINSEFQLHSSSADRPRLSIRDYPPEFFFRLAHWAKEQNKLNPWERSLIYDVGKYIASKRQLSDRQEQQAVRIIQKAKRLDLHNELIL